MNFAANSLLAIGASPLMSFCPEEMEELVTLCGALSVNIGCLDSQLIEASRLAAAKADELRRPWVLDPAGVGASALRTRVAVELLQRFHPTVIRGNASEILCLASVCGDGSVASASVCSGGPSTGVCGGAGPCADAAAGVSRGVDSAADSADALEAARTLARLCGAVVSVSGATDYITDGERVETVTDGSPLMSQVTAMGCTATTVTAAFLAVDPDPLRAATFAMLRMGRAGSRAASGLAVPPARCGTGTSFGTGIGTGTFAVRFLDALATE